MFDTKFSDTRTSHTERTGADATTPSIWPRRLQFKSVVMLGVLLLVTTLWSALGSGVEESPSSSRRTPAHDGQAPPASVDPPRAKRLPLAQPFELAQNKSTNRDSAEPNKPLSFEVNALWVRLKESPTAPLRYGSAPIKVEYRRSQDRSSPPQIGIVEDTPVGTGAVLRSAIWQAAITAALHRHDDLSGVDVVFRFQGRIDGPSAGGILCLALLSCLDGKSVPNDLAFTGTILPDGTIGQVAGIAHKLEAAKKRGCRRVIVPSFVRFQESLETGELVDLRQVANDLNLTLYPAESIEDAYRFAHGLPAEPVERIEIPKDAISKELDEWLKSKYEERRKFGDDIYAKLPEDDRNALLADPLFAIFLEPRKQAEAAYRSGQLFHAFDQIMEWSDFLQARERNKKTFDELSKKRPGGRGASISVEALRKEIDVAIAEAFKQCPDELRLLETASQTTTPLGAQHFTNVGTLPAVHTYARMLESILDQTLNQVQETKDEDLPDGATREELTKNITIKLKAMQLILANLARTSLEREIQDHSHLASLLPSAPRSPSRCVAIAKFFHSGFLATHQSLDATISELASVYGVTHAELGQHLSEADTEYGSLVAIVPTCEQLNELLADAPPESSQQQFLATLATQVCAHRIADSAGMVVRWSELNTTKGEDGSWQYERFETLSFMLRRARENAIRNLARCYQSRTPCPEALAYFQSAESQRDDPSADKVSVLIAYWKASLQSQALCMLFNPNQ